MLSEIILIGVGNIFVTSVSVLEAEIQVYGRIFIGRQTDSLVSSI